MSDIIGRTFNFPKTLWAKLDEDAKRCRRSSVKQLEAILMAYYNMEDVEIDSARLVMLGQVAPQSPTSIRVVEAENTKKKRRA